jgi:hypothetical protein
VCFTAETVRSHLGNDRIHLDRDEQGGDRGDRHDSLDPAPPLPQLFQVRKFYSSGHGQIYRGRNWCCANATVVSSGEVDYLWELAPDTVQGSKDGTGLAE